MKGQKELGLGDFTKIPNGLPGVENRMDLIYQGVVTGEITYALGRGDLHEPGEDVRPVPEEGRRRPGMPTPTSSSTTRPPPRSISAATHHMAVDYSCYEGMAITGRVDTVLSRGR